MKSAFARLSVLLALLVVRTAGLAGERVLFGFDDHSIPWQHNLKLVPVAATKHPQNPVLRRGPKGSADESHAILYGSVFKDGDTFRMWYLGMHEIATEPGRPPDSWRPMCYAESKDGIAWTKPNLGLVELNGNKDNNICLIQGEPHSLTRIDDFLSILYEPEDSNPSRRYKCAYIAHVPYHEIRGGLSSIGKRETAPCVTICATSPDGLTWQVVGDRPANASGERFEVAGLYRFGNFYYSTGQLLPPWTWRADGRDAGRIMLAYRSPDFVTWSQAKALSFARPGQLMNPPVAGQQTHMGAGLWNRGNVLVGLYGMWQDGPTDRPAGVDRLWGTHIDLGLVVSNDGVHFREPVTDFKVIPRGAKGEWDSVALLQGHAFVNSGDRTMIWYSHWDTGGPTETMEIGLATLRRDGFGYLSSKETGEGGHSITSTIDASNRIQQLRINAEGVTATSPLTLELLDDSDRPIKGFSGVDSAKVTVAGTQQEVIWPKTKGSKLPIGRPFAIKATFPRIGDVQVYALYLVD